VGGEGGVEVVGVEEVGQLGAADRGLDFGGQVGDVLVVAADDAREDKLGWGV
jgi:hypothetical protein